jgi:hypothetical protein
MTRSTWLVLDPVVAVVAPVVDELAVDFDELLHAAGTTSATAATAITTALRTGEVCATRSPLFGPRSCHIAASAPIYRAGMVSRRVATPEPTERRFFVDPFRARAFIVAITVFYGGATIGLAGAAAGVPALFVAAIVPAFIACFMAVLCLPSPLMWSWSWRAFWDRMALLSQFREAADVAGWRRRPVLTLLFGLMGCVLVAFVAACIWARAVTPTRHRRTTLRCG